MLNISSVFSPYKTLIETLAFAAMIGFLAWEAHRFIEYEQNVGYQRATNEWQAKQIEADKLAAEKTDALQKQIEEARNAADLREKSLQAAAAATVAVSNSLRDTIASIRAGVPTATVDALRHSTDTLATVLSECSAKYGEMAATADRHASDVKTLMDSWPSNPPSK